MPKLKRQRAFTGFVDRRLTGDTLGSLGSVGVECPLDRFVKPLMSQAARKCIEMLVSATCNPTRPKHNLMVRIFADMLKLKTDLPLIFLSPTVELRRTVARKLDATTIG